MLKQVAQGVLVHESEFMQSNAVVVQGRAGVLLIDAGITDAEIATIALGLRKLGQSVVAGFSTHPHWDHLLWHAQFGSVPRYGTARCAAAIENVLSQAGWKARVAGMLPTDIAGEIPLDGLFGQITGLPPEATQIPWDGPKIQIIEHQAHAPGHAALLIEESKVLVAGDMLSDVLIPILNLMNAADPIEDYLAALQLLESVADGTRVLIPGHGSVGGADEVRARIEQDLAYVHALRDNRPVKDPRLSPSAYGKNFLPGVHERQLQQLAERREHDESNATSK